MPAPIATSFDIWVRRTMGQVSVAGTIVKSLFEMLKKNWQICRLILSHFRLIIKLVEINGCYTYIIGILCVVTYLDNPNESTLDKSSIRYSLTKV